MRDVAYLVYMITSPDGKSYIGMTSNYIKRLRAHKRDKPGCLQVRKVIDEYGWEQLSFSILKDGLTLSEAKILENEMILKFDSIYPNGLNLKTSGNNIKYCQESKCKMSASAIGKNVWNKGKNLSPEHIQKLSDAKKGKPPSNKGKPHSEEHKRKLKTARQGRVFSDETRERMSKSIKEAFRLKRLKISGEQNVINTNN